MGIRSLFEIFMNTSLPGNAITLNCDECFVVMEYFIELAEEGLTIEDIKKPLLKHLAHCPDCREHHLQRISELEGQWKRNQNSKLHT